MVALRMRAALGGSARQPVAVVSFAKSFNPMRSIWEILLMSENARREVKTFRREVNGVLAFGDKLVVLFYIGVGASISHALFGVPRIEVNPVHLVLAIAAFIVIGLGWVVCRSFIRQRRAAASARDHRAPSFPD